MNTITQLTIGLTLIYVGCIAAAQFQPRHESAQFQGNAASQTAVANGHSRVTNMNSTQQDNRTIEGQPPSYTFWNAALDKALLLLLIWQSAGHKSRLLRMANGSNGRA